MHVHRYGHDRTGNLLKVDSSPTRLCDFEQFPFLEADVRRQQFGKAQQGRRVATRQVTAQATQGGVLAQGARHQRLFAGPGQRRQEGRFFDHEVRFKMGGENLAAGLCRGCYLSRVARGGSPARGERQRQGGMVFPREVPQSLVALHGNCPCR
mgnify:CR=1 FL=1